MEKVTFKDKAIYFAEGIDHRQYKLVHPKCREIYGLANLILHLYGFDSVITSMVRPRGTIMFESGVHATGRAIDFIGQVRANEPNSKRLRLQTMAGKICALVNMIYTRNDSKLTLIYHNAGSGWHFHCQIPWDKNYNDYQGTIPKSHLELGEADSVEFVYGPDVTETPVTQLGAAKGEFVLDQSADDPRTETTTEQIQTSLAAHQIDLEEQNTVLLAIEELILDHQMTESQKAAVDQAYEQLKELASSPSESPHKPVSMNELEKESIS